MQENCLRVLKVHEKRLLLNLTLQNLELEGKKVRFNWTNPFDKIANLASRQAWLPLKDLFCNQEIEFGISLSDLKIVLESLGLDQPRPALVTI